MIGTETCGQDVEGWCQLDDLAQFLTSLLRVTSDVLMLVNPLTVHTSFDAEAFGGGVALGVACLCAAMSYRFIEEMVGRGGKAIFVTGCVGFLCAAGLFHMSGDVRRTAEALGFSIAGVVRLLDGAGLVNAFTTLFDGRSVRGDPVEARDLVHPLVLVFTILQILFYVEYSSIQTTLDLVTLGLSCIASCLSYAGLVALVKVIARDSVLHPPAATLAFGFCLIVLLSTIYVPIDPLSRLFFLLAYPVGVGVGVLFRLSNA